MMPARKELSLKNKFSDPVLWLTLPPGNVLLHKPAPKSKKGSFRIAKATIIIMKKTYRLNELDCANCAAKMERRIKELEGVTDASVSFMTQRLMLETEAEDQTAILDAAEKIIKKIEPDCRIVR